jgi:broad specificity phosphatase PhoE
MQIIFVRHGQSTQNVAVESGQQYDKDNIRLTERGEKQAEKTGIFLKETFGTFDKIYCSPLRRCVQTCDLICKQLNYDKDIIVKNGLRETWTDGKTEGMSKEERTKFIENNEELKEIQKIIDKETNLFEKVKLLQKGFDIWSSYNGGYSRREAQIFLKKFLKKLKKLDCKKILVVSHGGIIEMLSKMIANISIYNDDIFINLLKQSSFYLENPEPVIETANCHIFGLLLENGKYEIVIPQNNMHLKNMGA